jgi:FkbM family methyltransferase
VVDVGANIGAFTLYVLQNTASSRILALEPAPDTFARMSDMLRQHNITPRFTLLQPALGEVPGLTRIDLKPESQFRTTGTNQGVQVPVTTLQTIVNQYGFIDFLKIDAEGAEYPCFLTAPLDVLRMIGSISMEYHPVEGPDSQSYSISRLLNYLTDKGFNVIGHRVDGRGYGMAYLKQATE